MTTSESPGPAWAVCAFEVAEASIEAMAEALAQGLVTSVALTAMHLNRIAAFDRRGPCLNSTPVLNPDALAEAAEADRLRAAGTVFGPLHGIPFTVKDSYRVEGLTVAAGSPAFADLVAGEDCAAVAALRRAGAIVLGKTNMPPMAIGGLQRGVYGRAESPYNPDYLAAAWHSGSSSGSGVAVAASLCAFGLGEETVSSGRSPASNNGLVAYTPSRGLLSIRGNWPLFPLRDVVVPHTRTVGDMLHVLDALMVDDPVREGDLWRAQTVVPLPCLAEVRPASFAGIARTGTLRGKRLGVPRMYVGKDSEAFEPIHVRPSVLTLWHGAAEALAGLGAELVEVDFPAVSAYEKDRPGQRDLYERGWLPAGWNRTEIGDLVAAAWEEFLQLNADPDIPTLAGVNPWVIHADPPEAVDTRRRKSAHPGRDEIDYGEIVGRARGGVPRPLAFPDMPAVMRGLETARAELFESWMRENGLDLVVFPANADIATANADVDPAASDYAWHNGTVFSNMNHVMRHLGIPSVSVPMGIMPDTLMPVNLTFAGAAYCDAALLEAASDYEAATRLRPAPPHAPPLPFPMPVPQGRRAAERAPAAPLRVELDGSAPVDASGEATVQVRARVANAVGNARIALFVDGIRQDGESCIVTVPAEERRRQRLRSSLAVAIAEDDAGRVAGAFAEVAYRWT